MFIPRLASDVRAIATSLVLLTAICANARADYPRDVRMALFFDASDTIPSGYLQRLKKAEYTHIVIPVHGYSDTSWNHARLKKLFLSAGRFGIKCVPQLETYYRGSATSGWNGFSGGTVQWNVAGEDSVPSMAPGANGIDDELRVFIGVIRQAFEEAKKTPGSGINWDLDYIHLGGGEITTLNTDESRHEGTNILLVGDGIESYSKQDRLELRALKAANGGNAQKAMQEYIARAFYRAAKIVRNTFARSPTTPKVLIYADMWDPTMNGKNAYKSLAFGSRLTSVPLALDKRSDTGMIVLPGFSKEEKNDFHDLVVLMPWKYQIDNPRNVDTVAVPYSLRYLTQTPIGGSSNFKVIYIAAFSNSWLPIKTGRSWWPHTYYGNLSYVRASGLPGIRENCLGYAAAVFHDWSTNPSDGIPRWNTTNGIYDQAFNFTILEFMADRTKAKSD
jgi:hypothetical protein